ncbi:MAG: sugar O-acetyltransferase [Proteobacteria bacterium]|nr:MAG: sugar O-acetyltransferase [Pseudomonadota bacterium]
MKLEFEKMSQGDLYLASDSDLSQRRMRARALTRRFNETLETELETRTQILNELFGKIGARTFIEPPFRCDYGSLIELGNDVFMNFGCIILDCGPVKIGHSVLMGPDVQIYAATHPLDPKLRATGVESSKPITIEDRVWIGGGSIICPGVKIGEGSVIGAGSVVTRDIPAFSVAVGNPCRIIRELPR